MRVVLTVLQPITEQQADDVSWCIIEFSQKWSSPRGSQDQDYMTV